MNVYLVHVNLVKFDYIGVVQVFQYFKLSPKHMDFFTDPILGYRFDRVFPFYHKNKLKSFSISFFKHKFL